MNGSAILCASEEESDEVISSGGIIENVMHGQGNVSMRDNDCNEVCGTEVEGKSLSVCTGDEIEIAQPKNNTIPKFRSIFFIFLCRYTHILLTVNKYLNSSHFDLFLSYMNIQIDTVPLGIDISSLFFH